MKRTLLLASIVSVFTTATVSAEPVVRAGFGLSSMKTNVARWVEHTKYGVESDNYTDFSSVDINFDEGVKFEVGIEANDFLGFSLSVDSNAAKGQSYDGVPLGGMFDSTTFRVSTDIGAKFYFTDKVSIKPYFSAGIQYNANDMDRMSDINGVAGFGARLMIDHLYLDWSWTKTIVDGEYHSYSSDEWYDRITDSVQLETQYTSITMGWVF